MKKLLLIFWCGQCFGYMAPDSFETNKAGHHATTAGLAMTWTFTNNSGNLLICDQAISLAGGGSGLSSTVPAYGGVSMVLSTQTFVTELSLNQIWYIKNPPKGGNTVAMTGNGTGTFGIDGGCMSFIDADISFSSNTSGFNDVSGAANTSLTTKQTFSPPNGDYIIFGGCWGSGDGGTVGAGYTLAFLIIGTSATGCDDAIMGFRAGTGLPTAPSYSWISNDGGAISSAIFRGVQNVSSGGY